MSTKNLARTVIEGGRRERNKHRRRESHRAARAELRAVVERIEHDVDVADEVTYPTRCSVRRSFDDKLGAADRWMRNHVGRPWDKVYAELVATFDTRTIAGRHVVFDHMAPTYRWRADGSWHVHATSFCVDAHGILRTVERKRWSPYPSVPAALKDRALAWANGRKVATHGQHHYWCLPTFADALLAPRYRQGARLDDEEARFFDALPEICRELLVRPLA